jgi:hypothetical protein
MVLQMTLVLVLGTMGHVYTVADTTPYESVNKSEKLYHENAVQTVRGVITDTKTITLKDGVQFMQMDVATEHGMVPVHLGPVWYMNEYSDRFDVNKGRSVSVVGSPGTVHGKEVLVASGLINDEGKQHMRLRHPDGIPAWVGSEKAE